MAYKEYITARQETIKQCIADLCCQPIIFAGAGLSKRYFSGPSWVQLLENIANENPEVDKKIAFYLQRYKTLPAVGEHLVSFFHSWGWGEGKDNFSEELFETDVPEKDFLKYYVAQHLLKTMPSELSQITNKVLKDEIKLLQGIHPHSVITTNYDLLCELIFPDYSRIVGQKIIRSPGMSIGEIFKMHGCVTDYKEIVLTKSDYESWNKRKKYLSAKLLTYFLEHPLLIVGYGAEDENVLAILRDIDEILASPGNIVPNIFYVIFDENINEESEPPSDILLDLGSGSSMRVNALYAKDFSWIYQSFAANSSLENVNPKVLRALLARTYDLVRHDIPRMGVQVDFSTLEQAVESQANLPKLLGITDLTNPDMFNAIYPHTMTAVAKRLGFKTWHYADKLRKVIFDTTGEDIKLSDNQYHIKVKSGETSAIHKYSEAFIDLLSKVQRGDDYTLALNKKS